MNFLPKIKKNITNNLIKKLNINIVLFNVNKIKIIIILIYIFINILKNRKFFKFSSITTNIKLLELKYYLKNFDSFVKKPSDKRNNLIVEERKKIIDVLSMKKIPNSTNINAIFFNSLCYFGNCIAFLNKMIFYCEIIGCHRIILNKKHYWFIKNSITINKYNITVQVDEKDNYIKNNNSSTTIFYENWDIFSLFFKIKPEIRINFLREEILLNLPKMITQKNDLYIHIRSGDIFKNYIHKPYAQPPLCFYQNILTNFNFSKIYIISQDKGNPVIEKLIRNYPNIIYSKNNIKEDISLLINAYNIVNSISSFLNSIIQLNYNLQYLWEYNIYQIFEKMYALFHDLVEYPNKNCTIFRMEPTSIYVTKMHVWKKTRNQMILMIKEKCINEFSIFKIKKL